MQASDVDRRLLRHLLDAPELSNSALAERAGLAPATAARRLDKLRAAGILQGQERVIDWTKTTMLQYT